MKEYKVRVYYSYCVEVIVKAKNEDSAQNKAIHIADNTPVGHGDWSMEMNDAVVIPIEE